MPIATSPLQEVSRNVSNAHPSHTRALSLPPSLWDEKEEYDILEYT